MAKARNGAPVDRSAAFAHILERVSAGVSVANACKQVHLSTLTFYESVARDQDVRSRFIDAKRAGCFALQDGIDDLFTELMAELKETRLQEVAEGVEVEVPKYEGKLAGAMVNLLRSQADKRQWAVARLLPKLYGDKVIVAGDDGKPIPTVNLVVSGRSGDDQ